MFASEIARELGARSVIIPPYPGEMSAFGLAISDLRLDFGESVVRLLDELAPDDIDALYRRLEERAKEIFYRYRVEMNKVYFNRYFDGRYEGQTWDTSSVPVPPGEIDRSKIEIMKANFHDVHQRTWGYSLPTYHVKLIMARVTAIASIPKPKLKVLRKGSEEPGEAFCEDVAVYLKGKKTKIPLLLERAPLLGQSN
jgi:N-methylhydantoinase A